MNFEIVGEELMGKKLGSVYKRHIGFTISVSKWWSLNGLLSPSLFVNDGRSVHHVVLDHVCVCNVMYTRAHHARDAHFVLTYTCSQVYIGCERLDQQNGFSFVRQWTCNHVTTGSVCPLVHFILIAWIGRFLTLPLEIAFFSPPFQAFLSVSTPYKFTHVFNIERI